MKKYLSLFLLIFIFVSCEENNDSKEVSIRLSNISQFDFTNIIVNTYNNNVAFIDLNSGSKSDYKDFEQAYRYAYIELEANGETYILQPIDYVGETLLGSGNYTYQIDISPLSSQYSEIILTLIEIKMLKLALSYFDKLSTSKLSLKVQYD